MKVKNWLVVGLIAIMLSGFAHAQFGNGGFQTPNQSGMGIGEMQNLFYNATITQNKAEFGNYNMTIKNNTGYLNVTLNKGANMEWKVVINLNGETAQVSKYNFTHAFANFVEQTPTKQIHISLMATKNPTLYMQSNKTMNITISFGVSVLQIHSMGNAHIIAVYNNGKEVNMYGLLNGNWQVSTNLTYGNVITGQASSFLLHPLSHFMNQLPTTMANMFSHSIGECYVAMTSDKGYVEYFSNNTNITITKIAQHSMEMKISRNITEGGYLVFYFNKTVWFNKFGSNPNITFDGNIVLQKTIDKLVITTEVSYNLTISGDTVVLILKVNHFSDHTLLIQESTSPTIGQKITNFLIDNWFAISILIIVLIIVAVVIYEEKKKGKGGYYYKEVEV